MKVLDFFGDCPIIDKFLEDKPVFSFKWFLLHYINVLLRSVGQVVFCNNPLSGLVILAACFIPDYRVGFATLLAGSIATLAEMILQMQPWTSMRAGLTPLNAILIGSVISSIKADQLQEEKIWTFICLGSFASIFICGALANTLGKVGIPYMTIPFNLVGLCSFFAFQSIQTPTVPLAPVELIRDSELEVDWSLVGRGILVSMSQVYAINHTWASIIMSLGVFISSPLLFIMSLVGATIGSFAGVYMLPIENVHEVYDGLWGYSAILSFCAISCVFFACNHMSLLLATVNTLGTVSIQFFLRQSLGLHFAVPIFTFPFVLPTMLFINVNDTKGYLFRIQDFSFPERQTFNWFQSTREKKAASLA